MLHVSRARDQACARARVLAKASRADSLRSLRVIAPISVARAFQPACARVGASPLRLTATCGTSTQPNANSGHAHLILRRPAKAGVQSPRRLPGSGVSPDPLSLPLSISRREREADAAGRARNRVARAVFRRDDRDPPRDRFALRHTTSRCARVLFTALQRTPPDTAYDANRKFVSHPQCRRCMRRIDRCPTHCSCYATITMP